jgi:hypothetical protein
MEMYRSKPISHYFRAAYFHPKYHCILWQQCTGPNPFHTILGLHIFIQNTIVSYGNNVQVQTHFTLFQGCIFSSKVHHCILWKCSGPNPFHNISGLYIFIQGTPFYPMEMFKSEPISLYFRAVYFHPRYTILSYGNVQVRTHFTLFQGCIFSSKVHHCILWKCSGPNPFHTILGLYIFIPNTVCTHCLWTQLYNYQTIQEAQLEFGTCEQLFCT